MHGIYDFMAWRGSLEKGAACGERERLENWLS
ncbi:hypothetical protein BMS3Bbin10_01951 [bacterium BMS3Bbin10]|nr:hypothetical protein BMS3Bbin10_01951 [bacterium BMS3Bbin10]